MGTSGVKEYVNRAQQRLFNTNRIERIWLDDYQQFSQQLWQRDGSQVIGVRRYGGLLLLRPLVKQFGVPRALAYIAQTPFRAEHHNLRDSALQLQQRALRSGM